MSASIFYVAGRTTRNQLNLCWRPSSLIPQFRSLKSSNLCRSSLKLQNLKNIFMKHEAPKKILNARNISSTLTFIGGSAIYSKLSLNSSYIYCDGSALSHTRIETAIEEDVKNKSLDWYQFWQLLKPQLHYFIGAVISAILVALANIQIPITLGDIVNVISSCTGSEFRNSSELFQAVLDPAKKIIKIYIAQAFFTLTYITCLTRMGERMATDLRNQLFSSLLKQDIAFYDVHKTGELINRLTTDVQDFKSSFKMCISQGLRSVAQIIGCGVSMYNISPTMAGLTGIVVPSIIGIGTLLGALLRNISKEAQHQVSVATGVAEECLGNIRTVRAFAMEDVEKQLFATEVEKSQYLNELLGSGIGVFQAGTNIFLNGVVFGTLFIGGSMIPDRQMTPGGLMAFLVSAQTIQKSLAQLSVMFGTFVRGTSAGARVFEYINCHPSIPLKEGGSIPYHSLVGEVEFIDVSFSYPTRADQEVIKNVCLKIPAGKVVALVGASGAGKSTIAQLLERFYDVSGGYITLDGIDIRQLNPTWLRSRALGIINQEPILFATSVKENIRYGRPDATDEEVYRAAKCANAHDFISGFPSGYDTVVGERGVTVSGGQKQRIAIARALLKNPSVIILDEATSALDAESESVVQTALETGIQGSTVLIIAHRLCTIQKADIIAVLDKGQLVEIGNHKTLLEKDGIYADLIKQQQKNGANVPARKGWFS